MKNNGYLVIDEQLNLLKSKNISIDNETSKILNNVNYYNLMCYKNIFYINGTPHKYKHNLHINHFYQLYLYDNSIKQILLIKFLKLKSIFINKISDYFGFCNNGFNESGYLDKNLYKKHLINKIYENQMINNDTVKQYYSEHGFLPIWVLLNSVDYSTFMNYVLDFQKNNIFLSNTNGEHDKYNEIINFSIKVYNKIISNEKVFDFNYENLNLNNLFELFKLYNIGISEIIGIYEEIIKNIPSITIYDLERVTKIRLVNYIDVK